MVVKLNSLTFFGADYDCGTYGAGNYGEGEACTTASSGGGGGGNNSGGSSSGGGFLADTGYDILLPLAFGASLVIASAILIIRRMVRAHRKS